jgi:hypothetical protein
MIFIGNRSKIHESKTEDTSMRRPDLIARRRYWEAVGRDTLLTLCVALPIAALVFIILHI